MIANRDFFSLVEKTILAPDYESRAYVDEYLAIHMRRFYETLTLLRPITSSSMRIVDIGSYGSLVPALKDILGLRDITITAPYDENKPQSESATLANARNGRAYSFRLDRFDLEEPFPYGDGAFDLVLFTEVLEHLPSDPVRTLSEINRITRQNGWIVLSTPNCSSMKSILKIMRGGNPNLYPVYTKQAGSDRHNREYAAWEVMEVLRCCGYEVADFKTVDVYKGAAAWASALAGACLCVGSLLTLGAIKVRHRGDTIFAVGRKVSGVAERYPSFLYT